MADDGDSESIFSKIIGSELFYSSSADLYLHCWVDLVSNTVKTKAPHLVGFGLPYVNVSDEANIFGNPTTRIRIPTDGPHWSAPGHFFGEATAVEMSATRSELYYSYKIVFKFGGKIRTLGAKIFQ